MDAATGVRATEGWAAYDLSYIDPSYTCAIANRTEDGGFLLGGKFHRWGYIAQAGLPITLRWPGKFRVRAQILIKRGTVGLGILTADGKNFHQQAIAHGAGSHTIEIEIESLEAPGPVILRHGSNDEAETEFELKRLEFQAHEIEDSGQLLRPTLQRLRFGKFPRWSGTASESVCANWLGTLTKIEYDRSSPPPSGDHQVTPQLPGFNEEYFEWLHLLEAVTTAGDSFTMVELGAGWGRWLVDASSALRQIGRARIPKMLIGVEAEPQHFAWMRDHFIANGLDPTQHRLIEAAVAAGDGTAYFTSGHANAWYGQAMIDDLNWRSQLFPNARARAVRAVSLATVLDGIPFVDLIDMDIQGAEAQVVDASRQLLNDRVKRVHIGTHSDEIEISLRGAFQAMGWNCVADYPNQRTSETPYGPIAFGDGAQSWINPRFE